MNTSKSFLGSLVIGAVLAGGCSANTADDPATSQGQQETQSAGILALDGTWKTVLPEEAEIEDFAIGDFSDFHAAPIYVLARRPGVGAMGHLALFRSDDLGERFVERRSALLDSQPRGATITVAPSNSNIIYIASGGYATAAVGLDTTSRLYRSDDGGETFRPMNLKSGPGAEGAAYQDVPVSFDVNPANPDHLVGATCSGVFRSLDGGANWTRLDGSPDFGSSGNCNSASLHRGRSDRDTIYVLYSVGEGGGYLMRRSTNGGGTWEAPASESGPFGGQSLTGFRVHPRDAKRVYVSDFFGGWLSSADGADSWFSHNEGLEGERVSNVVFNPSTASAELPLYIANAGRIRRWVGTPVENGGGWVDVFEAPAQDVRKLELATLHVSLEDGAETRVMAALSSLPSPKLSIARVKTVR